MTPKYPSTERLPMGMLLAATTGALDAYTYIALGGVFAGLQTGNMILMGVFAGRGNWPEVVTHLIPFLVFAIGTVVVRSLQHALSDDEQLRHRAMIVLGIEASLALVVALIEPHVPPVVTSSLVSVIAAAQLQEFRKIRGRPQVTVMMTGNLRTAAAGFYDGIVHGSYAAFIQARDASASLLSLIIGATGSTLTTHYLGGAGIVFAVVPLTLALAYLQFATRKYR